MANGTVGRAFHFEQCFQSGSLHLGCSHVLTRAWVVVELTGVGVEEPFAGFIEQMAAVGQVESRVVHAAWCHHRRRPRVHEVHMALGVVEGDGSTVAHHSDVLDAKVGDAPHFVEHHLGRIGHERRAVGHERPDGFGRHVDGSRRLVDGEDAIHLLEVADVACLDGLPAVHPQLSELQRAAVE